VHSRSTCHAAMAFPAGIESFRAMCPPSPGRGGATSSWQPDATELPYSAGMQDLGGIQGVKVFQQQPAYQKLVFSAPATQPRSELEALPPMISMSQSLPVLSGEDALDASEYDDAKIPLRSCHILLPSNGSDNDAVRIRNSGRKLHGLVMPLIPRMREVHPNVAELRRSCSEASLPSASPKKTTMGYSQVEPMSMRAQISSLSSPRTAPLSQRKELCPEARAPKGIVRKASTLHMTYPGLQPLLRTPSPPGDTRADLLQKYTFRCKSPPKQAGKMKPITSTRNEDDLAKAAAMKSGICRNALFALRRQGKEETLDMPSSPPGGSAPKRGKKQNIRKKLFVSLPEEARSDTGEGNGTDLLAPVPTVELLEKAQDDKVEIAETALSAEQQANLETETNMMVATLNSLKDSAVELKERARVLEELQDPVTEAGGARHPTAIIAQRNLSVVLRKAELLEVVEARIAALESKCIQKEDLFKKVTANASPSFEGMFGVRQFVMQYAHKPEESPADADKSNFGIFVATFGIPKKHVYFERMMKLANTTALWWASETLRLAENGAESDAIKRHMDVVNSIGADKSVLAQADATMKACAEILGARLAEQCLRTALKLQEKDKSLVERSKDAQPQSAKDCAAAINDDIRRAVSLGALQKHPAMLEAKQIVMMLEAEEKVRYGLDALLKAQKIERLDSEAAAAYEKKEGVPPVGSASEAADAIDKKIKDAIKKGAPESHDHIKGAAALAKQLRDIDGIRKRTANRAKRSSQA